MAVHEKKLHKCNELIERFEKVCRKADARKGAAYRCGVDLGTAYIVTAVVDENSCPVAGRMQYAEVVRDGMVVDYLGAVHTVRRMKQELEDELGVEELLYAAAAIPPGTGQVDGGAVKNVVESAGFELTNLLDESTAANAVLNIRDGAIVDIGGGTTGISIFKDGDVIFTADEPTGGTHFTLTLAGAMHISFDEAELYKRDPAHHQEILPILKPVVEKVAAIINQYIRGREVKELYLVGGTSCLTGMEKIISAQTGIETCKPKNPLLVTPLGIALNCRPGNN